VSLLLVHPVLIDEIGEDSFHDPSDNFIYNHRGIE